MHDDFKSMKKSAQPLTNKQSPTLTAETPQTDSDTVSSFKTPEQVAASDDITNPAPPIKTPDEASKEESPTSRWRQVLALQWPPRKKEYVTAGIVVLALLLIGGVSAALVHHPAPKAVAIVKKAVVKPKVVIPTTVPSTLTGLPVDPSANQRPVTAVMIENSLDARPQSGLSQAGVVFEAIAEGGVTRFMAVYQDTQPDNIGPVRSARPYYVQWALGFNAGYAHVGGSPDALQDIKSWGVRDLDQFANGGSYHRIASRDAPHNVYTAVTTLTQLESSKGYNTSTYTGFVRKAEAASKAPTARSINLTLSGPVYNPHYDYNAVTNSYNRSENGAPQTDQNTSQQLSPKVVIAMVTPLSRGALDATGAYYSNYVVTGSGAAYIFQDGTVTIGQWSKPDNNSQISFTDASGKAIGLNPGQTWLTAVSAAGDVSYTP